ncbi:MAG: hypothetical protein EB027_01755 [Actinobacteria bacterium]|nr:hypothetical protein [Actinomycetota bacterium]
MSVPSSPTPHSQSANALDRGLDAPIQLDLTSSPATVLGMRDQLTLWASLGVSLLIPATAVFVLQPRAGLPPLSLTAVITAIVAAVALGSTLLALAAVPGTATGAPTAAMLRGLLGRRGSWVPTVLNLVQCLGWAALEVYVIAEVATAMTSPAARPWWVLAAGVIATLMAVRPLRSVRVIRKYLMWLVLAATVYLIVVLVREGISPSVGTWDAFWPAFDIIVTMPISWALLASDWSRHSTSTRATVLGTGIGYGLSCAAFFTIGVLAIAGREQLAQTYSPSAFVASLLALPVGALAVMLLAVDEVDEAFANIYSTAITAQNIIPRVDRRVLAIAIGSVATALAGWLNLERYESFLLLIGAVFLPLVAVLLADWYIVRRIVAGRAGAGYDVNTQRRWHGGHLLAWASGAAVYSLVSPAQVPGWARLWDRIAETLPWLRPNIASASIATIVVTALVTVAVGLRRRG